MKDTFNIGDRVTFICGCEMCRNDIGIIEEYEIFDDGDQYFTVRWRDGELGCNFQSKHLRLVSKKFIDNQFLNELFDSILE